MVVEKACDLGYLYQNLMVGTIVLSKNYMVCVFPSTRAKRLRGLTQGGESLVWWFVKLLEGSTYVR